MFGLTFDIEIKYVPLEKVVYVFSAFEMEKILFIWEWEVRFFTIYCMTPFLKTDTVVKSVKSKRLLENNGKWNLDLIHDIFTGQTQIHSFQFCNLF